MKKSRKIIAGLKILSGVAALIFCVLMAFPPQISAHGGKDHGENEFTSLKALEKAVGMYDELIAKGKLDPDWETGLSRVELRVVESEDKSEYGVSFH